MSNQYYQIIKSIKDRKTYNAVLYRLSLFITDYNNKYTRTDWLTICRKTINIFRYLTEKFISFRLGFIRWSLDKPAKKHRKFNLPIKFSKHAYIHNKAFHKFIINNLTISRLVFNQLQQATDHAFIQNDLNELERVITKYRRTCLKYFRRKTYIQILLKRLVPPEILSMINGYSNDLIIDRNGY